MADALSVFRWRQTGLVCVRSFRSRRATESARAARWKSRVSEFYDSYNRAESRVDSSLAVASTRDRLDSTRNRQLFKDFYAYIAKGDLTSRRDFPTFQTGHEELILCDAISLSARERRWVPVSYK